MTRTSDPTTGGVIRRWWLRGDEWTFGPYATPEDAGRLAPRASDGLVLRLWVEDARGLSLAPAVDRKRASRAASARQTVMTMVVTTLLALALVACGSEFSTGDASSLAPTVGAPTGATGAGGAGRDAGEASTTALSGGSGGAGGQVAVAPSGGAGGAGGVALPTGGGGSGSGGAAPSCDPTTCEIEDVTCGIIPDGCGGVIDCGPHVTKPLCDYHPPTTSCQCPPDHPIAYGCADKVWHEQPGPAGDCVPNEKTNVYGGGWLWCCAS